MDYFSHKSKGYIPLSSGPNRAGFYSGSKNNLLNMMQTGGVPDAYKKSFGKTSGGAEFARAMQRVSDAKTLKEYQKREAERQKRGRLFGSVGGLGLGLLGAALAPATGGLSLALASGAGTALGKYAGESIGAGKAGRVDRSGTVYNQQGFRDIETAGQEYDKGKFGRAAMSGIQAGLTAGFAPSGGMYGKVGGKLRTGGAGFTGGALAMPSIPEVQSINWGGISPSSLPFGTASDYAQNLLQQDALPLPTQATGQQWQAYSNITPTLREEYF